MSDWKNVIDQAEDEIPACEISDEAVEAVATTAPMIGLFSFSFCTSPYICPWRVTD